MVAHRLVAVLPRLAAEAAVHREAEVVEELRRGGVAALQAGDAVERQDDAQEHARVAGLEVAQRGEEAVVLAAQVARAGQVQPVDRAAGLATAWLAIRTGTLMSCGSYIGHSGNVP